MLSPRTQQGDKSGTEADKSYYAPAPAVSLPKGGGAIKGMGEKFAANPVTGTGSMSVPIATSPGRSGFGPQLSVSYDSGAGNDIFGLGWDLSLPSITRKTDKGLPRYWDAEESDVFILSGAEDLVPVLRADGSREILDSPDGQFKVHRYRPRIEGLFARIERWTKVDSGEVHWRSMTKDNITTLYGQTAESRIVDPSEPTHIFSWLICESYDDKGNAIRYEYKAENSDGIVTAQVHERNRTLESRSVNRYLKRIKYGNLVPRQSGEDLSLRTDWLFEAVFDYGEHDLTNPRPNDAGIWTVRNDPFSSYRAGFEVRTYRLCQRVLMFHHFPNEVQVRQDCLVRSLDLTYSYEQNPTDVRNPIYSFLLSVTQTGYKRNPAGGYIQKSLPPLEFTYSEANIDETVREVDRSSLENLPYGLDGTQYQWVDLDGEGLSGILTEQGDGWFYKRNLSPINTVQNNGVEHIEAQFAAVELVASKPANGLGNGAQFLDLAGDGQPDLVTLSGATPGFYERTQDEDWETFVAFKSLPVLDWDNPNLKFIDLNGDGHSDILISEDHCFVWHPSLAEDGFAAAERVSQPWDEEKGPRVIFADSTQSIHLADMSGDGLTDIVRIRNGEVCYWPNLGYGRFGAKVTMDDAPWFDAPDIFDQRRIQLADIDGSGTTDILYLSGEGVQVYFNQSGNGWAAKRTLSYFPVIDNLASITAFDLLGNGTACLVWSSPLPSNAQRAMRYIDLMGGQKPHLLIKTVNNLGAETVVQYAPSTKFYLQDKVAGTPWITKLPFPVHVVERVETYDRISGNRFVSRSAYHHGYFDGVEREFRGFGMVEQWDTEEIGTIQPIDASSQSTNLDPASFVPPILTKTWFHTGAYLDREHISSFFADRLPEQQGYYREPNRTIEQLRQLLLEDTVLPSDLTVEEEREACRALKGSMLRQEVYALDGTDEAEHPYTVTEQNFTIRVLQRLGDNRHAVFFTHAREAISYHYERNPADPRVSHALTLEVDEFGNVTKSAAVNYPRRAQALPVDPRIRNAQASTFITYTEADVMNRADLLEFYRIGVPFETRVYEVTGLQGEGDVRFLLADLLAEMQSAAEIAYEVQPTTGVVQKRLVERDRILYFRNDLSGALPLGELESLALPFETYRLAFTPELLERIYGDRINDTILGEEGRYVEQDGLWWIPSGQAVFDPGHFYLPIQMIDPFGQIHTTTYDNYDLLTVQTADPLGNTIVVANDYRVLQPWQLTDPNGNRAQVAFDTLGMVVGTAVMGKSSENRGDSLEDFDPDLDEEIIFEHIQHPLDNPQAILGSATTRLVYDLWAYYRSRQEAPTDDAPTQPAVVYALARETHGSDLTENTLSKIQHSFVYSDGFGREIQTKIQAEPGLAPVQDGEGVLQCDQNLVETNPRWLGTGRTIFNNKGKPVKQYEPFFSPTHEYENESGLVECGVTPIIFYDPIQRVVATLHPNHTYDKVVFDPWQQTTWDANDTVLLNPAADEDVRSFFSRLDDGEYLPTWYEQRSNGELGSDERRSAQKTEAHANTPSIAHLDSLGRPILTIADNGEFGQSETRVGLDIEGNSLYVEDARGNLVMANAVVTRNNQGEPLRDEHGNPVIETAAYNLLSHSLYSHSSDAGERWTLNNVAGNPIRGWNSRGFETRLSYDALQRPTHLFVRQGAGAEVLAERTVYGEIHPEAIARNLRGKVFQHYDSAGVASSWEFDIKGNLLRGSRQLSREYREQIDWLAIANLTDIPTLIATASSQLEPRVFDVITAYDALNRPISIISPDGSEARPTYNEANLLEQMRSRLRGGGEFIPFVTNIDYNEKGQRTLIEYDNGVRTEYTYDRETFRLTNLRTTRIADSARLQDLHYTYDPVGNITSIGDDAQQTIFFNGQVVSPHTDYTYDALYQLRQAEGREHRGQTANNLPEHRPELKPHYDFNDSTRRNLDHPHNGQAMRNYSQDYQYDLVGNILAMIHRAEGGDWTRNYEYAPDSNRLLRTSLPENQWGNYRYDAHGNMIEMPHLPLMLWDFNDRLQASSKQVRNDGGTPEITYYVYDAGGQRVRKVTERTAAAGQTPTRMNERIYLGGFEIYREYNGDGTTVTLERETLHVMDDQQRIALVETKTIDAGNGINLPTDLLTPILRYQLSNHLGSTSLELDADGAVLSYEEYHPYGTTAYQAGRSVAEVSLKRYRYTGKERDEETGLNYHGARYYATWLGRWMAADPIGLKDGVNRYAYAKNNPETLFDPGGNKSKSAIPDWQTAANAEVEARVKAGEILTRDDQMEIVYRHRGGQEKHRASTPVSRDRYGIELEEKQKRQREARQSREYDAHRTVQQAVASRGEGLMPIAEIAVGFTPADILLDFKDAITAIDEFLEAPSANTFGNVFFAGVAFFPGVGNAAKAGWKGVRGIGDDVIDAAADAKKVARRETDDTLLTTATPPTGSTSSTSPHDLDAQITNEEMLPRDRTHGGRFENAEQELEQLSGIQPAQRRSRQADRKLKDWDEIDDIKRPDPFIEDISKSEGRVDKGTLNPRQWEKNPSKRRRK